MEVKIEVHYFYYTEKVKCKAKVSAYLPKEEGGYLHSLLRNEKVIFFGDTLESYWGTSSNDKYRTEYTYLEGKSWEELKEKVRDYISKEIEKLRKVKEENERMINSTPKDEIFTYEI